MYTVLIVVTILALKEAVELADSQRDRQSDAAYTTKTGVVAQCFRIVSSRGTCIGVLVMRILYRFLGVYYGGL